MKFSTLRKGVSDAAPTRRRAQHADAPTQAWRLFGCAVVVLLMVLFFGRIAHAQTITNNSATVDFPNSIQFDLSYDSSSPIVDATLVYSVDKFSCVDVATSVPVEVETDGSLSWTWQMIRSGNPPPGTDVSWQWELTDAAGNTTVTDLQTLTLSDDRFEWRTLESDRITLHWYRGDEVGPLLLESAESALERLESDMGIVLNDSTDIWVYGSSSDMRDAMLYVQGWAGGVAFTEYNTMLLGVAPSSANTWGVRVTAHEFAHLVLGQYGRSCVGGGRPTWLEEGFAMYAEGAPETSVVNDINEGIDDDSFAPIRALTSGFPAHDDSARDAYSQSYSIVDYLVAEYGAEQMQDFILTLADGFDTDDALEQVYGINMDSLDNAWRADIGASLREVLPTVTPVLAEAIPTFPPIAAAVDVATPTPEGFVATESVGSNEVQPLPTAAVIEESAETPPAATSQPAIPDSEALDPTTAPTTPPQQTEEDTPAIPFCSAAILPLFLAAPIVLKRRRRNDNY